MKKILTVLIFMFGAFTVGMAQTTSPTAVTTASKQNKAAIEAQKKANKQALDGAKKQAKEVNPTSHVSNAPADHLNKNGTPDKRFKANKQPAATPPTQAQTPTSAPVQTQATATPAKVKRQTPQAVQSNNVKTADKAIGTDAQGRTIYQGPRGGKYYIDKNGHKEYVK
ncbi:MAG: hypothetical protein ABIW47_15555 [Ginsengibacter sp.]|jgi:hypothetical protein